MWLRLVQSARDKEEQNLEAYVKNGQLFYRSLRRIEKDEELLVWYGKDLIDLLLLSSSRAPVKSKGEGTGSIAFGRDPKDARSFAVTDLPSPARLVPPLLSRLQPAVPVRVPLLGPPSVPLHQETAEPHGP